MIERELVNVEVWLSEIRVFTNRAISPAGSRGGGNLSEDDDLFWACDTLLHGRPSTSLRLLRRHSCPM